MISHARIKCSIAEIGAMQPIWEKYRMQLMDAELRSESNKFIFNEDEQRALINYRQRLFPLLNKSDIPETELDEDIYLVIPEKNDYARNNLSRSLFTLLENKYIDTHRMMHKDSRAIYIESEKAKIKIQEMIIDMITIDKALIEWVETWHEFAGIQFERRDNCLIIFLANKENTQCFTQKIKEIFGITIDVLSETSLALTQTDSLIVSPYIDNIVRSHAQNEKHSDDKATIVLQRERMKKYLETANEKFIKNIHTINVSPIKPGV